jgi:methionyl-tRNA synthetase
LGGNLDLDSINLDKLEPELDLKKVYLELEQFNTQKAIQTLFSEISKINQYLEQTKPWILAKDMEKNSDKINEILTNCGYLLLESSKVLSIFLPITGQKIIDILQSPRITKPQPLFAKIV